MAPPLDEDDLHKLSEREKIERKDSIFGLMKIDTLISTNLMEWMVNFTEEQLETIDLPTLDKRRKSYIRTFALTQETLPIYQEFVKKLSEAVNVTKSGQFRGEESPPITHISAHMFFPIKELLEWRKKANRR